MWVWKKTMQAIPERLKKLKNNPCCFLPIKPSKAHGWRNEAGRYRSRCYQNVVSPPPLRPPNHCCSLFEKSVGRHRQARPDALMSWNPDRFVAGGAGVGDGRQNPKTQLWKRKANSPTSLSRRSGRFRPLWFFWITGSISQPMPREKFN